MKMVKKIIVIFGVLLLVFINSRIMYLFFILGFWFRWIFKFGLQLDDDSHSEAEVENMLVDCCLFGNALVLVALLGCGILIFISRFSITDDIFYYLFERKNIFEYLF